MTILRARLTMCSTRCYAPAMVADVLRLAVLKRVLNKLRELLSEARDVRFVSVPLWKPWRDYQL